MLERNPAVFAAVGSGPIHGRIPSASLSKTGLPGCPPKKKQKAWRERNPDYFIARRIQDRGKADRPPEPLRLPPPLSQLPWDIAQDEFGVKGADFIGVMGTLLLAVAQDQFEAYVTDSARVSGTLPPARRKTRCGLWHSPACGRDRHEAGVSPTGSAL